MKNLKLKLTMIVTIIAIIMMNAVVFAATNMEINSTENNKTVTVSVTFDSNLKEGFFNLSYPNGFTYKEASNNVRAIDKGGYVRVNANDEKLAGNYVATFTFELAESKTTTGTFEIKDIDFTGMDNKPITVENISKNVTVEFKSETPSPEPSTEPSIEPSTEPSTVPSKEPSQTETTKPNPSTNEGTKGEVGLNDKKPTKIPQAGTNVVPYIVGGVAILMVAGLIIINNRKNK